MTVRGEPVAGRFNTTPDGNNYLQFYDLMSITFSVHISAFGMFGTDWGDFAGRIKMELTTTADVVTLVDVPHTVPAANGALMFWGFTHPGTTYKKVRLLCTYELPPEYGNGDYFGVDDIIVGMA